jgi:Ca2+/Na+ antiporter
MELKYSLYSMLVGSFIIQFIVMSCIMTNSYKNITFSVGKFYMSVIMALLMGLLEVFMFDIHMRIISLYYYLILFFMLSIFIYLYRNQIYIEDKDYLQEMIEHHSMAVLTSEEILQKTQSERVKKLAETILTTQEKEIEYMRQLIKYELRSYLEIGNSKIN